MDVLLKPIVTEKISSGGDNGIYGFIVSQKANKNQLKKEVEKTYSVVVNKVNTMKYIGKKKTKYTKTRIINGKTSNFKKAIVYLKSGHSIDFYN